MFWSILVSILCAIPATQPSSQRGRDPWVFRCVLDDRPRVVVVALQRDLWCAYDAATCSLLKVWRGDIELTGSVYDTRHGPQPVARGTMQIDASAVAAPVLSLPDGSTRPLQYAGYRFSGDAVIFRFHAGQAMVEESPESVVVQGAPRLFRQINVSALPDGAKLAIPLPSAPTTLIGDAWLDGQSLIIEKSSLVVISFVCDKAEEQK